MEVEEDEEDEEEEEEEEEDEDEEEMISSMEVGKTQIALESFEERTVVTAFLEREPKRWGLFHCVSRRSFCGLERGCSSQNVTQDKLNERQRN